MQVQPIIIFGAGGLGREIRQLIQEINERQLTWHVIGFADDNVKAGTHIDGLPVLGGRQWLQDYQKSVSVVVAIGDPLVKKQIAESIATGFIHFPVLIHPSAIVSETVRKKIGKGTVIAAGNIFTVDINIGAHVLINLSCTIGHDTVIGDYSSVMPGVNISGEVTLEEGVFAGTGACVLNRIRIGAFAKVGAGAVVTQSLPAQCTAVGVPAKPVKFHTLL